MPDKTRIMQNIEEVENNGNQCSDYFNRVIGFVEDIVVSEEFQNQELFKLWKSVLPTRRELKPTDRVCERHFNPDDIVKTFDHIINGVLHQIDRGKPKLCPLAVPSFNLPPKDSTEFNLKAEVNEPHRKSKMQHVVAKATRTDEATKTRRPIIKRLNKDFNKKRTIANVSVRNRNNISKNEVSEIIDDDPLLEAIDSTTTDDRIDEHSNVEIQETTYELQEDTAESATRLQKNERTDNLRADELTYSSVDANLFDEIYEDIYEVTLPNTLWGLHRDPNRTFVVFSYYDEATCSTSKLVRLDNYMNTQIYVRGKMVNKYLANLSIEYLTSLVSQVDEYRVCEKFDSNSECEVVAAECNLCTACRLNKG